MGSVGQELAQPVLSGVAFGEGLLDFVQHRIEGDGQSAYLRRLGAYLDTLVEVSVRYPFSRVRHPLEGRQPAAQYQPGPHRKDQEQTDAAEYFNNHKAVKRGGYLTRRQSHYDPVAVGQLWPNVRQPAGRPAGGTELDALSPFAFGEE